MRKAGIGRAFAGHGTPVRVVVTNDDGVRSPGLHVLARTLVAAGCEVAVVAPAEDMSGFSAALGRVPANRNIEVVRVELDELDDVPTYAIAGPPGLAVFASCVGALGDPPHLVVSGINAGANTGHAILHSGTVGAALTAQNFGACGLAVSLEESNPWQWETAAAVIQQVLPWFTTGLPPRSVLNVNVPACAPGEVRGLRAANLARFGTVRAGVAESWSDAGPASRQIELRDARSEPDPESDAELLRAGFATYSSIRGISETGWRETPDAGVTDAIETRVTTP